MIDLFGASTTGLHEMQEKKCPKRKVGFKMEKNYTEIKKIIEWLAIAGKFGYTFKYLTVNKENFLEMLTLAPVKTGNTDSEPCLCSCLHLFLNKSGLLRLGQSSECFSYPPVSSLHFAWFNAGFSSLSLTCCLWNVHRPVALVASCFGEMGFSLKKSRAEKRLVNIWMFAENFGQILQ